VVLLLTTFPGPCYTVFLQGVRIRVRANFDGISEHFQWLSTSPQRLLLLLSSRSWLL